MANVPVNSSFHSRTQLHQVVPSGVKKLSQHPKNTAPPHESDTFPKSARYSSTQSHRSAVRGSCWSGAAAGEGPAPPHWTGPDEAVLGRSGWELTSGWEAASVLTSEPSGCVLDRSGWVLARTPSSVLASGWKAAGVVRRAGCVPVGTVPLPSPPAASKPPPRLADAEG